MKKILSLFVILSLALIAQASAQSFQVIVNEANTATSISKSDLSDIFLKKSTKWDDGTPIIPIDQTASSSVRGAFSEEVHGRGVGAIRSFWQQAAFSGAGTAPLEKADDAAVIAFVKNNPGAVGYISADTDASGVNVLTIE